MTANKKFVWRNDTSKMQSNKHDLTTAIKRKYRSILTRQPVVVLQDIFSNAKISRRYSTEISNSKLKGSQIKYRDKALESKQRLNEEHETRGVKDIKPTKICEVRLAKLNLDSLSVRNAKGYWNFAPSNISESTKSASDSFKRERSLTTKSKNVNHSYRYGHTERNKHSNNYTYITVSSDASENWNKKRVREDPSETESISKRLKTDQNERRKRKAANTDVTSDYTFEPKSGTISSTDSDSSSNKINRNNVSRASFTFNKNKRRNVRKLRRKIISDSSSSSVSSKESSFGSSASVLSMVKDNDQSIAKESNEALSSTRKNLPIITDVNILPKGTFQILKRRKDCDTNSDQNGVDLTNSKVINPQEVDERNPEEDFSENYNGCLNTSRHSILLMDNYLDDRIKEVLDKEVCVPEEDNKHDNNQEVPETTSILINKESSNNSSSVKQNYKKNIPMSFKINSLRNDLTPIKINEHPSTSEDLVNNLGKSIKNINVTVRNIKCDNNKVDAFDRNREIEFSSSTKCAKDVQLLPLTQGNLRKFTQISDNRNGLAEKLPKFTRLSNRDLITNDKRQEVNEKDMNSVGEKKQPSQKPSINDASVTKQATIKTIKQKRLISLQKPDGTVKEATGRLKGKKNHVDISIMCSKSSNTLTKGNHPAGKEIINDISKDQNKIRNFDREKHGPCKETKNNLISKKQNNYSSRSDDFTDLTANNMADDDCISLYAESICFTEVENPVAIVERKPTEVVNDNTIYEMNDSVIESYVTGNKAEFLKDFKIVIENEKYKEPEKPRCTTPVTNKKLNVQRLRRVIEWKHIFSGLCFSMMKVGECVNSPCQHSHKFGRFINKLYDDHGTNILEVMDYLTSRNCCHFSKMLYTQLIGLFRCGLIYKMFEKLYHRGLTDENIIQLTVGQLLKKIGRIKTIIDDITKLIYNNDWETAEFVLNTVEKYIPFGNYWNTLKKLVLLVKTPNTLIIEKILRECVDVRQIDAPEINTHLIAKLDPKTICQLNPEILLRFTNILCPTTAGNKNVPAKQILQNNEQKREVPSTIMSPISPVYVLKNPQKSDDIVNGNQSTFVDEKCNELPVLNAPQSPDAENNILYTQENKNYVLHEITDLPAPCSTYGRQKFWKFYVDLYSLQQGLLHRDYDYVVQILQKGLDNNDETFFSRACYQILCKEIKHCPKHLKEIVALTVQTGTNDALRKMLLDISVYILIRLADKQYWVLAYQLLKDLNMQLYEINAAVTILFAEVYLANQYALKAYILLKHSNIIYTNRSRWTVPNNEKDDYIRARIISVLLDALCEVSPELALFLFEFLIDDQFNNFYPIDLPRAAHKMLSIFLLKNQTEFLTTLTELIIKYNFGLGAVHCRALIAKLFNVDMCLAKQLYQIAIGIGVYSRVKFFPAPHAIMNLDWTKEEIHLALLELIRQLLLNIGHGIDRIKPTELRVYLVFEMIRTTKQLHRDRPKDQNLETYFRTFKTSLKHILLTKFSPSLTLVGKYRDKTCKLNNFRLLQHLKHNSL